MTLPKSLIISKRDTKTIVDFKKRLALRDNLKLINRASNCSIKQFSC